MMDILVHIERLGRRSLYRDGFDTSRRMESNFAFPAPELIRKWNLGIENELPVFVPVVDPKNPPIAVSMDSKSAVFRVTAIPNPQARSSQESPVSWQRSPVLRIAADASDNSPRMPIDKRD
jgi:hypothetical protein